VNSLAQRAASAALDDEDHIHRSQTVNSAGLKQLTAAVGKRGLNCIPSVGNFICVDVGQPAVHVYQALLKQGVIVRPIANYGFPNHLRITVGTHEQNQSVIEALDRVLDL
jgi:histidinol-phosphate aminotransferase